MAPDSRYDPDLHGPHRVVGEGFHEQVYALVCSVPPGRVSTYGDVGAALGLRSVARQVGWALAALPADRDEVPWHRVVNAQGRVSRRADGGPNPLQVRRLVAEGLTLTETGRVQGFAALRWSFDT